MTKDLTGKWVSRTFSITVTVKVVLRTKRHSVLGSTGGFPVMLEHKNTKDLVNRLSNGNVTYEQT